jgi:putative ABC transport system substrate-binding protein
MKPGPLPPPTTPRYTRRRLLALALYAACAPVALAQSIAKRRRVAYFNVLPPAAPAAVTALARFREGMQAQGFSAGVDYEIDYAWEESIDRVSARMRSVIGGRPELVVAITTPVALAAAKATREMPIVFGTVSDPVASGLVQSLARPGGNVTGVANVLPALSGKLVELAREILPGARRIAVLWNPDNPAKALELHELEAHAQRAGIACLHFPARSAAEIEAALTSLDPTKAGALVVLSETLTHFNRERIARLALAARMPTLFNYVPHVEAGGLAAYSPDYDLQAMRLGELAGRILAGASPATLPVEQPNRFLLTVNLRTARALGLELSPAVLLRADKVIE